PVDVLAALDPEQREAAEALTGPVCILAGAGTGKTRAITHRIAAMVHAGIAPPGQILAVTFTTRAAGEMRGRLRALGADLVEARTFHSAALHQLRYFWPRLSRGPQPTIIESKLPSIRVAAGRLRVHLDPATQRDVASEIEWAKAAQVPTESYAANSAAAGRQPPLDAATIQKLLLAYEDVNHERGQLDFEDLLVMAAFAIEQHRDIAAEVRERYRHFVVDEYQDVNPLQQRLLDAWLGNRDSLCVVGDPNQTIYSFTGASASYLTEFPRRWPGATVVRLVRDYRSTAQIVEFANRLTPGTTLLAQAGDGPAPATTAHDDEPAEAAGVVARIKTLQREGVPLREMAVLYRVNAQSEVYEAALGAAGIPYLVRGGARFFERPEVKQAILRLRVASHAKPSQEPLTEAVAAAVNVPEDAPAGRAAREAWESLRAIVALAQEFPHGTVREFVAELDARAEAQHAPPVEGVTLASLHAAKGLEWDAVFLVGLVDGTLPITHASTPAQIDEERRLLYVGITRARRHLALSWAAARAAGGRRSRKPSRFLEQMGVALATPKPLRPKGLSDDPVVQALREWRLERSRDDGVPAYVVFDNKTLEAIAERRPADRGELASVPGVGPAKLERYADDVLRIVRR
ncbi:MAG: ATP-dependent helicase UvrD/PcrA, partial [Frankiaceae bacterium]|nr:ATP-dependent helicase UvrD/PcrA [Frankiaceae bacterium]